MSLLSARNLTVALRGHDVLRDVSFDIGKGECVGLVGPNSAGKTTLMRAVLGLLPFTGQSGLAALPETERATQAAWMPQARETAGPVTVETVVMLGRTPYLNSIQNPAEQDRKAVESALVRMELTEMRHRDATQLSGGEQARVLIARALAQDTPLLVADEPIAGLDSAHQISTMRTFAALASDGKSSMVSLHDLGLAARRSEDAVVFLTSRNIRDFNRAVATVGATVARAVATVGLSNAERVGHRNDRSGQAWGTINIAVRLDRSLTEVALLEAMSIAVKARTAAVMDVDMPLEPGRATLQQVTSRGGIRIDTLEGVRPVAYETLSPRSHRWTQAVSLCLPEDAAAMNRREVLTELGGSRSTR